MKRIILVAFMLFSTITFAQTNQGSWLIGGTGGFVSTNQGTLWERHFISLSPSAGYFLIDNWAVGLSTSLNLSFNNQFYRPVCYWRA
jgi:hypothetical protein